jgi:hypothetical protein
VLLQGFSAATQKEKDKEEREIQIADRLANQMDDLNPLLAQLIWFAPQKTNLWHTLRLFFARFDQEEEEEEEEVLLTAYNKWQRVRSGIKYMHPLFCGFRV